jgi:hypothetical protein
VPLGQMFDQCILTTARRRWQRKWWFSWRPFWKFWNIKITVQLHTAHFYHNFWWYIIWYNCSLTVLVDKSPKQMRCCLMVCPGLFEVTRDDITVIAINPCNNHKANTHYPS